MKPITRRSLVRRALAAGMASQLGLARQMFAAPSTQPTSAPESPLILGVPLTHSDWMLKPGIPWGPAGVRHMLDACKACGWSQVYWRAFDGGRSLYKSKLLRPGDKWDADSFWSPQSDADRALTAKFTSNMPEAKRREILDKCAALDYGKFDSLAEAVRYGHEIGLEIHAWLSINEDDHGWGFASEFAKAHPQFRWKKRSGVAYHSQLSFAFDDVRQYKLALLDEILSGYAIDGLFIDWIRTGDVRDNPQTDSAGVADSGYEQPLVDAFKSRYGVDPHDVPNGDDRWVRLRAEPQTHFMREARQLVARRRGKLPIAVLVAHPWHYRGLMDPIDGNLRGLLIDVRTWAREGLMDAAVAAGYYRPGGSPEAAYHALRQETEQRVDVWTYAWVPRTVEEFQKSADLARRVGARQMLLWEADYIDDRPNATELKAAMARVGHSAENDR